MFDPKGEFDEKWMNVLFAIPTDVYMSYIEKKWVIAKDIG